MKNDNSLKAVLEAEKTLNQAVSKFTDAEARFAVRRPDLYPRYKAARRVNRLGWVYYISGEYAIQMLAE